MKKLTKEEILFYFEKLNEKLAEHDQNGELLICGGASMVLLYDDTILTQDIDGYITTEKLKKDILQYALNLQEEFGLEDGWFNESAKGFIDRTWPQQMVASYSNLTVKSVPAEQLLAMKLTSARYYGRDQEDAIKLMKHLNIHTPGELLQIVERNMPKNVLLPKVQYFALDAFDIYQKQLAEEPQPKFTVKRDGLPDKSFPGKEAGQNRNAPNKTEK